MNEKESINQRVSRMAEGDIFRLQHKKMVIDATKANPDEVSEDLGDMRMQILAALGAANVAEYQLMATLSKSELNDLLFVSDTRSVDIYKSDTNEFLGTIRFPNKTEKRRLDDDKLDENTIVVEVFICNQQPLEMRFIYEEKPHLYISSSYAALCFAVYLLKLETLLENDEDVIIPMSEILMNKDNISSLKDRVVIE